MLGIHITIRRHEEALPGHIHPSLLFAPHEAQRPAPPLLVSTSLVLDAALKFIPAIHHGAIHLFPLLAAFATLDFMILARSSYPE